MTPLDQFDLIVPAFKQAAGATTTAQLDQQTPCTEWQVRNLFEHMFVGATVFAGAVRQQEVPPPETPSDDALSGAAVAAVEDVVAAFGEDGALGRTVQSPFGPMDGETFARILAIDLLVHTWDLCRSTGQEPTVDGAVVAEVDAFARNAISDAMRGPQSFGPAVDVPADAPAIDRLAGFTGRTP